MERKTQFVFFLLTLSFSPSLRGELVSAQNGTTPVPVGVVLDLGNLVGKMCMTSISMALDDFYAAHGNYTTRVVLHTRDSSDDVLGAASAALDLLKNVKVQAIIGPLTSAQAMFVISLGNKTQVPILSFSATSPSLSPAQVPYFLRTGLNSSSQVNTIASLVKAFGWREVVPIYEDTEYGTGFLPYLIDALQGIDARVPYRLPISPSATDDQITKKLHKLMDMQTRVFVVHMLPSLGSRLFLKAKRLGMMNDGYVWIITEGLTDLLDSLDPIVINSMQGVLGVKPYLPMSKMLNNFTTRWRYKFHKENPHTKLMNLSIFGLWAYDTVWALAMAIEEVGAHNLRYQKTQILDNSTDLMTLGISEMGPRLREAILRTKFKGLGGAFHLLNGQLQSSAFLMVNVIGKGWRNTGFWTPGHGFSQKLNPIDGVSSTSSMGNLEVIWPGGAKTAPKGWEIPTGGKKLRVGVPTKAGFSEFVKVEKDPITNATKFSGYCIDIFDAVIKALPYTVPYEYIPFDGAQGSGTYDDLVYQVFLQKFDAVVGDITIIANRSLYVDFSLPYTESGVSMIVPIKKDENNNAWTFLKPLSTDLWVGTLAFFFFTGFVVWVIEHRINNEFRGPPSQQMGTIFYFAFSTLVFAHREKIESNLSRIVVIIWVFVVLVITSSYTASLTSMLTAQQLQPTVTDINDLLKNGDTIGYQDGSFVEGLLKQMNFDESKLKPYGTPSDYAEALSKGSHNGGVAAIVDEIPYIKNFLSKNCSDYIMVGPTYKTDGFGFVFSRGSLLVPDISRAVLNVTQGDKMFDIENTMLGNSADIQSYGLKFQNFWGLFLITGAVSTASLFICFAMFFWKNWDELKTKASQNSLWRILTEWAKHYDQKDLSSHTFKKDEWINRSGFNGNGVSTRIFVAGGETPQADGSQSLRSTSDHLCMNSETQVEMASRPSLEASTPVSLHSMELTEVAGRQ